MKISLFVLCLFGTSLVFTQVPYKRILLNNGFVHVGNGDIISNGVIGITEGRIKLVRNALAYTIRKNEWDTIIDLGGQHVYPGFVASNSTLGLTEIDAVRATNDFHEVGEFNPHIRSLVAYNVESKVIETVRTNGVLLTQACPRGGKISGTSSVFHLGGWNWEDAVVKKDDGIHLNWPTAIKFVSWHNKTLKKNESYADQKAEIMLFFEAAKAYAKEDKLDQDLRFEAMRDLFKGNKRLYIHAEHVQQLVDVIEFCKQMDLKFPVIVGGYDSYLVSERLRDAQIPVMLQRLHSLPKNEDDPVDLPYRLPALLKESGVLFCLQNEGDMEAMNARNLPFLAGTAHAYGLSEEEAIRSISLSVCEIMGMEKHFGSIEAGKKATLFVSSGNALEMLTNQVTLILMDGRFIELENHQQRLYEKYKKKYGLN